MLLRSRANYEASGEPKATGDTFGGADYRGIVEVVDSRLEFCNYVCQGLICRIINIARFNICMDS